MTPGGVFAGLFDTGAVSLLGYLTPGGVFIGLFDTAPFSFLFLIIFKNIVTTLTQHKAKSIYTVVGFNMGTFIYYHLLYSNDAGPGTRPSGGLS